MIRRPPRSTLDRSSAASDVYKRQILGKAPISGSGSAEAVQIEGIPASDVNGLFGGTDPADNSGELTYISIRHGGANIGEGNEINGLTLGGVGSGTKVENIEIISNQDDGLEVFGGSVNIKNVIVWNAGDDQIDCDQAWTGTLDNFIACLLYTSPSPRDRTRSRMPSSA